LVYDSTSSRPLLFGGRARAVGDDISDLWEWDGAQGRWTELDDGAAATSPPGREMHRMAYDVRRSRLVLFGGYSGASGDLADVWEWKRPSAP
jgi:hypothetical protein